MADLASQKPSPSRSFNEDIEKTHLRDGAASVAGEKTWPGKGSEAERRALRKIDIRLIPALAFMYGCSLIDRANLPNARLAGMEKALGFSIGNRYTITVCVFFIPYILTEIPANLVLKAGVPPRFWLPFVSLCFGLVMIGFGFAESWKTIAGLRVPLGAFEGALFPGSVFLVSSWYPRYETQKRLSGFYLGGQLLGGFGNIIAYGFSQVHASGKAGWEWIFILMGVLTCTSAIVGFLTVPNFPDKATFLTPEERQIVHDRIQADRADMEYETMTFGAVLHHLGNIKIWAMGLLFMCSTLPAYAFAYFLSLILRRMGYSIRDSQLLSTPPYIAAIIIGLVVAYSADKLRMRGPFIIAGALVSMTGSLMLGYCENNGVRYFGAFLAVIGCSSNIPTIMTWSSNNVRGMNARAISSAVVVAGGGIGGIIASVAFREKDAKTGYRSGLWTTIAAQLVICVVTTALMMYFRAMNNKARDKNAVLEGRAGFLYTL